MRKITFIMHILSLGLGHFRELSVECKRPEALLRAFRIDQIHDLLCIAADR